MSWHTIHFGEIADFRNGLNYSRENFGTGLKVISVADFGVRWTPDIQSLSEINPDGVAKPEDYLDDGDLLFVRSNGNRDLVGRVMLVQYLSDAKVGFSGFCIRARLKNPHCNPAFYAYLFRSPKTRQLMMAGGVGASISNVSQKTLAKLIVPLPSRAEQDAVVDTLRSYDDLIAINQRRIALLEDASRRLYREWFVHLRFPGHESVVVKDGVPQGWSLKPLGNIAPLNYGKSLKATERKDGNVPVYGSSGIVGVHNVALVGAGAIVVGRKGNVGSLYYSHEPCFPIDTVFFISPDKASYRLFLALHQLNFISSDAAVPGLNRTYAQSLPLLLPTEEVQTDFERLAAPIFEQIQGLTQHNRQLAQARDLLLPKLMSSQFDVSAIALPDEVAA